MSLYLTIDSYAQDIIFTKDGSEIQSKVIEIDESIIKYKLYDQQDGPISNINKLDVFMVKYQNGTIEKFTPITPINPVPTASNPALITNSFVPIKNFNSEEIVKYPFGKESGISFAMMFFKEMKANKNLSLYYCNHDNTEYTIHLYNYENKTQTALTKGPKGMIGSMYLGDYAEESKTIPDFGFSPDGTQCYAFRLGNQLVFYNDAGDQLKSINVSKPWARVEVSLPGLSYDINQNQILTNGSYIYSDGFVQLLINQEDLLSFLNSKNGTKLEDVGKTMTSFTICPQSKLIAGTNGGFSKKIWVWSLETGSTIRDFEESPYSLYENELCFSSDGKLVMTHSKNFVLIWEVSSGRLINKLDADGKLINCLDISPQNILGIGCYSEKCIKFYDLNNNLKLIYSFNLISSKGKPTYLEKLKFSNDGNYLIGINSSDFKVWKIDTIY